MNVTTANDIIENNVRIFLSEIKSACQIDCKKIHTGKSDFPIFHPANKEFFEYKYYEGVLEWYIREYLVLPILKEFFKETGRETIAPKKKDSAICVHFKYSNDEFGKDYPFAFVIPGTEKNTAIHFTQTYYRNDELSQLFKEYNLECIEVIDWTDTQMLHSGKTALNVTPENRKRVYCVTLKEFFLKYFSGEIYQLYLEKINNAVEQANKEIGFNTIPNLSLRYLSDFKAAVLNELSQFPIGTTQYQRFDKSGEASNSFSDLLPPEDYEVIERRLKSDSLLSAFTGNEKFAKCFLTSEYLYQIFRKGNENFFDYSSVVTGYFKSVELLLEKIMDLALDCSGHEDLWIQYGGSSKKIDGITYRFNPNVKRKVQVRFKKENKSEFSTEMGPLIWFLHDRADGWNISDKGMSLVHDCLRNYNQGCRNEHLHKDVIDDIESIRIIRSNTILCLCFLLGGCKLTDTPKNDSNVLGIESNSYDELYKKLVALPRSIVYFYIKFPGKEPIKAIRCWEQESPQYDAHGNIQSKVVFVRVDDFQAEIFKDPLDGISEDNMLFLSRDNLPERIWWYNKYKGQVEITW